MTAEICRRADLLGNMNRPNFKNWTVSAKDKLLVKNPILVMWCLSTANVFSDIYYRMLLMKKNKQGTSNDPSWAGNTPYLRLYYCLIKDEVREANVSLDDVMT